MVIVQFESAAAIENADAIMAVDGVDMVLIGTNDLLADYGLPGQYDHPRVHEAYTKTLAACQKHGKHLAVGGFATRADLAAKYVRLGARYVSTGTDLGFLLAACTAKAKEVQDMASQ
jgi:4-hydroxy-2-oxoheptanedioate aldolase